MEISKCLTISTAHITEDTSLKIKHKCIELPIYDKAEYGWWICAADVDIKDNIPSDLLACIKLAHHNGCEWLCIDCDGEVLDCLPVYNW